MKSENREPINRFILRITVADATGSMKLLLFDECSKTLLETNANIMQQMVEKKEDNNFKAVFEKVLLRRRMFTIHRKAQENEVKEWWHVSG